MAIANDEDLISWISIIKEKGLSVLFADTEIGENLMVERYNMLKKNFDWKGSKRFNMISKRVHLKISGHDLSFSNKSFYAKCCNHRLPVQCFSRKRIFQRA